MGRILGVFIAMLGLIPLSSPAAYAGPPVITGFAIDGTVPAIGMTANFTAAASWSDGSSGAVAPSAVQWHSSNPRVAVWVAPGVLLAVSPGTATVKSRYRSMLATKTVTITAGAPTIQCPPNQTAWSPDSGAVIATYPRPTVVGGQPAVTQRCGPESGSRFDIGNNNVTCNATDSLSRSATCTFTMTVISREANVTSLYLSGVPPALEATSRFTATATLSDGTTRAVAPATAQWDVDNPAIAAWMSPGVLRGVTPGTTRIVAEYQGFSTAQEVTIVAPGSGTITLIWDPNPPTDNIVAYEVAYGTTPGVYTATINVGTATNYAVSNLSAETAYVFTVRALSSQWSGYSPEVINIIP